MAAQALTQSQMEKNEAFWLTMMETCEAFIWEDTGNIYEFKMNSIKPEDTKGFVELVDVVGKNFARQYVSVPDVVEIRTGGSCGDTAEIPRCDVDKEKMLEQIWRFSANHTAVQQEKTKKVKKGKKNRGKR